MASLLREAGAAVPAADAGADLAFIASEDSPGAMLMEVKAGNLREAVLAAAEAKLQHHVNSSRAELGLVVYHDVERKALPARQLLESVVRISLERLIEQLGARSLPDVIADLVAMRGRLSL